ncbi:hypothetical protein ABTY98_17135 [Streptomyces sp. NPDC096040]
MTGQDVLGAVGPLAQRRVVAPAAPGGDTGARSFAMGGVTDR